MMVFVPVLSSQWHFDYHCLFSLLYQCPIICMLFSYSVISMSHYLYTVVVFYAALLSTDDRVQLQVDDIHELFDANGNSISNGRVWNNIYNAKGAGPFAIYAENGVSYAILQAL